MDGGELYRFQVDFPRYDNLLKYLLRTYSGLFQDYIKINETQIQNTFNLSSEQLQKSLQQLEKLDVIDYIPENNKPQVTFITERLAANDFYISKDVYENRKKTALTRMNAMIKYVQTDNKCRSQLLLSYFGEKNSKRCGACDVCISRNKTQLSELEFDILVEEIKPILKKLSYAY